MRGPGTGVPGRPVRSDPVGHRGRVHGGPHPGPRLHDRSAARAAASRPIPEAAARVNYVLANQTTADTPGLLPHPITGQVVNLIDASRPFITSHRWRAPDGRHPRENVWPAEDHPTRSGGPTGRRKNRAASRKMVIGEVPFTKATYGGSRWTCPARTLTGHRPPPGTFWSVTWRTCTPRKPKTRRRTHSRPGPRA